MWIDLTWLQETAAAGKDAKGKDKEKVKSAKKIQKDMEKWAKKHNQKKTVPVNQVQNFCCFLYFYKR